MPRNQKQISELRDFQRQVVAYVTKRFIKHGRDSTIKEIAESLDVSESRVRRLFAACQGGLPRELRSERVSRESHSRNYPGINIGCHFVDDIIKTYSGGYL